MRKHEIYVSQLEEKESEHTTSKAKLYLMGTFRQLVKRVKLE